MKCRTPIHSCPTLPPDFWNDKEDEQDYLLLKDILFDWYVTKLPLVPVSSKQAAWILSRFRMRLETDHTRKNRRMSSTSIDCTPRSAVVEDFCLFLFDEETGREESRCGPAPVYYVPRTTQKRRKISGDLVKKQKRWSWEGVQDDFHVV